MLRNQKHAMSMSSSRHGSSSKIIGFVDVEHHEASIEDVIVGQGSNSPEKTPLQNVSAQNAQINQWMKQRLHRKTRELQAQE